MGLHVAGLFKKVEIRAASLLLLIAVVTAVLWVTAATAWRSNVPLLAVAYTLGLRHALDADHLAAIDKVTRKLIQAGEQPVTVGLMFSLGHSSVVILATMLVAVCSASISRKYERYHAVSGFVGSTLSSTFLIIVGLFNAFGVYVIYKKLREIKAREDDGDGEEPEQDWQGMLSSGGPVARVLGRHVFAVIDQPWKMYFVGFLFGLGFDTATEMTIIAIASMQGKKGVSPTDILFLPLLFTSGMALLDFIDGLLMLRLYGWALVSPTQKLYYNLIITSVSSLFALFIALVQVFGLIADSADVSGPFWGFIGAVGARLTVHWCRAYHICGGLGSGGCCILWGWLSPCDCQTAVSHYSHPAASAT